MPSCDVSAACKFITGARLLWLYLPIMCGCQVRVSNEGGTPNGVWSGRSTSSLMFGWIFFAAAVCSVKSERWHRKLMAPRGRIQEAEEATGSSRWALLPFPKMGLDTV